MILITKVVISLVVSYLLGALPTAYIWGRWFKKVDIRQMGSGNVGATNAFRVLGKQAGIFVLLIDILKGILATTVMPWLFQIDNVWWLMALALTAVIGHVWTVFLSFQGGKGIATSLGSLIGLAISLPLLRLPLLITLGAWIVIFLIFQYVSLASIVAALVLPCTMVILGLSLELVALGIIFCIILIFRHRPNIKRLITGKETRVQIFSKKNPKKL